MFFLKIKRFQRQSIEKILLLLSSSWAAFKSKDIHITEFLKTYQARRKLKQRKQKLVKFFQSELFRYRQLFILQNVLISLESNWKGISNNNRWHNDSAQNRKFDFCRALNTSRIYFLNSTTWSSSPALMENACAHASNFLNLLADDDRIVSSDLGGPVLSVVKRTFVFVAVSMDCTIQTTTSAFKS